MCFSGRGGERRDKSGTWRTVPRDEVKRIFRTEAELGEPVRPAPYVDLDALDTLIRRPGLLPPGVSVDSMAPREYKYSAPGMKEPLRVTTDPEYFDQHATSVELWSPGSPLFPKPEAVATVERHEGEMMRPLGDLLTTGIDSRGR